MIHSVEKNNSLNAILGSEYRFGWFRGHLVIYNQEQGAGVFSQLPGADIAGIELSQLLTHEGYFLNVFTEVATLPIETPAIARADIRKAFKNASHSIALAGSWSNHMGVLLKKFGSLPNYYPPYKPLTVKSQQILNRIALAETGGRPVFFNKQQILAQDLVNPDFFLAYILNEARNIWRSATDVNNGRGGFTYSVVADENSCIGYRVNKLSISHSLLFLTAITGALRELIHKDNCLLDDVAERFELSLTLADFLDETFGN
ncbi:hypothetical protein [Flexibacterium corallicola]|uniref:hypothetical protein n=1 Tax=Flexibacterium corallicola TaxID=3037259 RepID=UPI00286ED7CF|nr:hypothetical protein [Pseudovibrio sp. M1P-2-3]